MHDRVLILDEDVRVREFLYDLISEVGFGVLTVPTGSEVLERLKKERPHLIFIDDSPGEYSGFLLARKIREFDKDIKIVILGKNADLDEKESLLKESGIAAYLNKDFDNPETIKAILSILKQETHLKPETQKKWGRILIVDDELENRQTVSSFLRRRGFEVETAASGEEGLEKVRHNPFDVILLDITMTGMDGLLTLKRIRDMKSNAKVVMVTGLQNKGILDEAKALGACDYLIKPFNFNLLESCLLSILLPGKIAPWKTG